MVAGERLGYLFRSRQWRYLLNLIDQLPSTSRYQEAISQDDDYARSVMAHFGGKLPESKSKAPPLHTWTAEVAMLAQLVMEMRSQTALLQKINSAKGAPTPQIQPVPVPETAFARIKIEKRFATYAELASKLVPDRS